jgi:hypothetical protein
MTTTGRAELEGNVTPAQATSASSLDQVREILFGAHHRELARRLARTDAHLAAHADELRSETRRRLEALENHVNKEAEALATSLESQRAAQTEAVQSIGRESREALGLLEQRVKKLEELTTRTQRDFRQQLLDQANTFIDEVRQLRAELGATVAREVAAAYAEPGGRAAEPVREELERPSEAA